MHRAYIKVGNTESFHEARIKSLKGKRNEVSPENTEIYVHPRHFGITQKPKGQAPNELKERNMARFVS